MFASRDYLASEVVRHEFDMKKKRTPVSHSRREPDGKGLRLIAVFKLAIGLLLVAVGIGALKLLHKDVSELAANWVAAIRVDPDNRLFHGLIAKLGLMNDRKLEELSIGSFSYGRITGEKRNQAAQSAAMMLRVCCSRDGWIADRAVRLRQAAEARKSSGSRLPRAKLS